MAKLSKVAQKLFGSGSGFHQIIKFGSTFAGSTAYTTDIAEMMSLSNWLTGWYAAAIGGNAPTIQDMNACHTVFAYQLAYLMQAGVAEWDAVTPYYTGSLAQDGSGVIYTSLTDANVNNALTDTANWKPFSTEPVGSGKDFWGTTLPAGFIWASGKTIGDASSNATERANIDTLALYTLLWNAYSNTLLPIYDSTGTPTTRGANAAADFAAHKALSVIDKRGRISVGKDNLGGTAANRITVAGCGIDGTILGNAGGEQVHTLITAEMPAHTHTQTSHTHTQSAHTHLLLAGHGPTPVAIDSVGTAGVCGIDAPAGPYVTNAPVSGSPYVQAANPAIDATTAVNQSTGGDGAHNNVQPSIMCNYILKL